MKETGTRESIVEVYTSNRQNLQASTLTAGKTIEHPIDLTKGKNNQKKNTIIIKTESKKKSSNIQINVLHSCTSLTDLTICTYGRARKIFNNK